MCIWLVTLALRYYMMYLCKTWGPHRYSCSGSYINTVSLGFSKAQAFPVKIGMQRIDYIGWKTFVKQKSENVVAIMSGRHKSNLNFVCRMGAAANVFSETYHPLCIVWDGKYICQNFTLWAEAEAFVLVLGNINTHTNHGDASSYVYLILYPQGTLPS